MTDTLTPNPLDLNSLTKFAYETFQQSKQAFGFAHKTLSTRFLNAFADAKREEPTPPDPKMLQLLQNRIGQAGEECVSAEHEHRQAVGMGKGSGGEQIRGARSGGGRGEHEAAAVWVVAV